MPRLIDAISFLADIELVRVLYPAKTTFSENEIKRIIQKQNTLENMDARLSEPLATL